MNFIHFFSKPESVLEFVAKLSTVFFLIIILVVGVFLVPPRIISGTDFIAFYLGGKMVLEGYATEILKPDVQKYLYEQFVNVDFTLPVFFRTFPLVTFIFLPFSIFTLYVAYKIYFVVNTSLFVIAGNLIKKSIKLKRESFFDFFYLLYWPVITSIFTGQLSVLFFFLTVLIFSFKGRNSNISGMLSSLFLFKIQLIVFVPFLFILSKRRGDFVKWFLFGVALLVFLTSLSFGVENVLNYPRFVVQTESAEFGAKPQNLITFASFLTNVGFEKTNVYIINFVFYLFSIWYVWVKRKILKFEAVFFLAIFYTIIFSIHIGIYDLVLILIPMIVLLQRFLNSYKKIYFIIFLVLFFAPFLDYLKYSFLYSFLIFLVSLWFILSKYFNAKKIKK